MKTEEKIREPYEKPKMVIEKVELATVAGNYVPPVTPIQQLEPFFGLCCP